MLRIKLKLMVILFISFSLVFGISEKEFYFRRNIPANAATIESLAEEQERIQRQLELLKKEKAQLSSQTKELQGELSWLNTRTKQERDKYAALLDELNSAYTEMENAVRGAQTAEENVLSKQEEYRRRLQVMFENRNKGTLEMLFDAKDLSAFLANIRLISIIADNDKKVLESLQAAKDEASIKRAVAQKHTDEMKIFVDAKNKEIEALRRNISQTEQEIQSIRNELQKAERDEKALMAESNKISQEIKKLQTQASYYGGDMKWPTPGYTYVNPVNGFGMRLHPIYRTWRMHNGIDIGAPFGAKIVAVADGKVILTNMISGYDSTRGNNYGGGGYGNYLTIDHGGGISSLYAHCKLLMIKNGESVKAGQVVAQIGSTGLSTGPHLHFEIRENGTPVDPLQKKYLGVIR
jgi:murein DD-endopeptidase MepM/ murein hydrolase activator NlpD